MFELNGDFAVRVIGCKDLECPYLKEVREEDGEHKYCTREDSCNRMHAEPPETYPHKL